MIDVMDSEVYKKVREHRGNCSNWMQGFCLECFGGGLNQFVDELEKESK